MSFVGGFLSKGGGGGSRGYRNNNHFEDTDKGWNDPTPLQAGYKALRGKIQKKDRKQHRAEFLRATICNAKKLMKDEGFKPEVYPDEEYHKDVAEAVLDLYETIVGKLKQERLRIIAEAAKH